jgi:hypothetical protein
MNRRHVLKALTSVSLCSVPALAATAQVQGPIFREHLAWVTNVLIQMQSIKPGMTRERLLSVFTTEGGLSTGLQRTYVSKECPYFKVAVEFQAVGRPDRDEAGGVTLEEDNRDTIKKISVPYLEFSITD